MQEPKSQNKRPTVTFSLSEEERAKLVTLADLDERNVSAQMAFLYKKFVSPFMDALLQGHGAAVGALGQAGLNLTAKLHAEPQDFVPDPQAYPLLVDGVMECGSYS